MPATTEVLAPVCLALTTIFGAAAEGAPFFTGLGDLEGGGYFSQAKGVSADGSIVVGLSSSSNGTEAFRWSQSTGIVGLGDLPGASFQSQARGISGDGQTIVGLSTSGTPMSPRTEAFRWTQADGMFAMGDLVGEPFGSEAMGASNDGSVVVGQGAANFNIRAYRWTQASGMVDLGTLQNNQFGSWANAVSGDGAVVVGGSNSSQGNQAFRWQQGAGIAPLGDLPGGNFTSEAFGVSTNGAVIVGSSASADGSEAFRWTEATGMVGLGDLGADYLASAARGASSDGSVIVGYGSVGNSRRAMIWDAVHGMRNLRDVLVADNGLEASLVGWSLFEANSISPDGMVITGTGVNPNGAEEAWIVSLKTPVDVSADFDSDGDVDGSDFLVWQHGFGSGVSAEQGDANGDGAVTSEDLAIWTSQFGSPTFKAASSAIPEPTSATVLSAALACGLWRWRRSHPVHRKRTSKSPENRSAHLNVGTRSAEVTFVSNHPHRHFRRHHHPAISRRPTSASHLPQLRTISLEKVMRNCPTQIAVNQR